MLTFPAPKTGAFHFKLLHDIVQEDWFTLCHLVTRAHRQVRLNPESTGITPLPVICNGAGITPLRYDDSLIGLGVIVFNGEHHHQLSSDTFILNRHRHPYDRGYCHTHGHPYRFMVMAVLLLAQHTCPNVWKITSDVSGAEWQHVADWLYTELAIGITLPTEILAGVTQ
ncbi:MULTISPECIES: hypothetical protein [Limnobaculum]|uniref:Uncharacterized protein n=1 Tax=Limnobaculum eriocheiris TaxID=2897391 RepID=A0A9X1MZQ2_9GAMM|nr:MULTISPECIES: hypothetical protein [Limnobaculum]MCD1127585.1 hypothetical protein [Limnobaculum eriocheiris]